MGSPLGPIIANIFMNDFEEKHMEELINKGVKSWDRFVDDTCVIVKFKENADQILNFLNEQHNKIKFTLETEKDNSLNFLDVKIKRKDNLCLETSTYRKPTFTGVMLNWNSLTSIRYKTGLIKCLLDRLNKICSSEQQKEIEMAQLRLILLNNNYPSKIIDKEFEKFLKYKTSLNTEIIDNEIKTKYISLPYINDRSEMVASKLKRLVKAYYPKINLRVAFKSPAQLGDHFPFKDRVEDPSKQSNVVYHLKCLNCDEEYIGKTTRICSKRMSEHEHSDPSSHVYQHNIKVGHKIDFENVKILDRASNDYKLQLKEMLWIRKFNPSLNRQMNSELFTLIIRNTQKENYITRDIQKHLKPKKNPEDKS